MGLFGFVILTNVLLKCYGHTYAYHHHQCGNGNHHNSGDKSTLSCTASGWQIDFDSQMPQTGPCSRQCELNNQVHSGGEDGTCQIEARSELYACVCNRKFKPIYNPRPDVVDTYIVAVGDKQSELVTQQLTEGSPIHLNCSFKILPQWFYVIYWLKVNSGDGRATCISSCSSEGHHHHQTCSEEPLFTSRGPLGHYGDGTHNVSITSSQLSDSGVYVCILNKTQNKDGWNTKDRKRDWIIIRNITVSVTGSGAPNPTREKSGADVGWYVAGAILLILLAVILLLAKEKMKSNQAHQSQMTQRSCHGDQGITDPDCSPYAMGVRQNDPYSVVHIRKQTDSVASTPAGPSGQSSDVPEPYSVVQLRPQADSTLSTPAGQTADMPETYSVITPNRAK